MKQLFDERKAKKHRQMHWCRRPNAFSDMPIWRLAAARCNMPLYQLLAFVNRLEEHANDAANKGLIRGSLQLFDPDEFGVALGMTGEECARLYAELEDPRIAWIVEGHIASFTDRNPDREEDIDEARNRKRRQRSRERILKQLAKLERAGKIDRVKRLEIEVHLRGISDDELQRLQDQLARAELSTGGTVTCDVTNVTRDFVTVTPEKRINLEQTRSSAADNSGHGASGESGSFAKGGAGEAAETGEEATRWIDKEGTALIVQRLMIHTNVAITHRERWRRDLQDDEALRRIIVAADERARTGAQFHVLISDAVERAVREQRDGRQLGLMPPRPGSVPKGPEVATSHDVTSPLVDKLKRSAS